MYRQSKSPARRSAFTLLEVLLASAITLALLFALYVVMKTQLQQADADRETVERATVIRGIMNRFTLDLTLCIAPISAVTSSSSNSSSSTSGSSSDGSSSSTQGTDSNTNPPNTIPLQAGVIGTSTQVTIYAARVPDYNNMTSGNTTNSVNAQQVPSDLRRITYWLATDGGLARDENAWVTSDDVSSSADPVYDDEKSKIIAEEVTSLQFQYYDPTAQTWQDQWDGSTLGTDGATPIGPPTAIRVILKLKPRKGETDEKEFRQVIAILTAPGSTTATSTTTTP